MTERKKQESPAATSGVRAETEAAGPMELNGISLLEVLNLIYLGNDEIEPEQQVGRIQMEFDNGNKELYYQNKVFKDNSSIRFGDTIFLTDKFNGPICSVEELEMKFNLFRGAYKSSLELRFEPFKNEVCSEEYRIRSVDGTGQIRVMFGFYPNATVANLKINIQGATNVHGIVAARNSQLDYPSCTSVLFWKSSSNAIELGRDGAIPLLKSRVGVPLDSELYVDIALHIDGEIHKETISFVPRIEGEKSEEITFPNKETMISVKVKWDSRKNSVYSTYSYFYGELEEDEDDSGVSDEGIEG